jgi:predicted nucleic acid-binding protein
LGAKSLEKTGLKSKDAVHIACVIETGCKYFITVDKGILNKSSLLSEIIVIDPIDYYRLEED